MAEPVGILLYQLRTARGWTLGQLAQRAGIHKSALSRWEAGTRQPRIPELEAALTALEATPAQHALALAGIEAPRAIRHLHTAPAIPALGPLPSAGDLLRAMRLRGNWTQEQIARRLGVRQNTVARWELGERLPSKEQIQTLCFALKAREEELVALTTGRIAESSEAIDISPEAVEEYLGTLLYNPRTELVDLRFLIVERALWQQATQEEPARALLARMYAAHAHYLSLYQRWDEVTTQAQRALALTPQEGGTPEYILRAVLKLAAAEVYGGNRPAPERGFHRIKIWLSRSSDPDYTAWMLSDMGKYLVMAGQREGAVELGEKSVAITRDEQMMRHLDYSSLLVAAGAPGKALDHLTTRFTQDEDISVYEALIRCEAHLSLGERDEAAAWLTRAYAIIETEGLERDRFRADALAQRL